MSEVGFLAEREACKWVRRWMKTHFFQLTLLYYITASASLHSCVSAHTHTHTREEMLLHADLRSTADGWLQHVRGVWAGVCGSDRSDTVACRSLVRVCLDETIVPMRAGCLDNRAQAPARITGNNMTWRNHNSALVLHMHAAARPTEEHVHEKSYI